MAYVSGVYLKVEFKWVSEWHPCLERIWTVSESWIWMSIRMVSVSGAYLNCIWKVVSEWVSKWHLCLERIRTVSWSWIWISIRMASVSGAYMNCIWKLCLNEYQNDIRVWSASDLYLKVESEWVSECHLCLEHIWTVSERLWTSLMVAFWLILSWKR